MPVEDSQLPDDYMRADEPIERSGSEALVHEFDRQLANLQRLNYPQISGIPTGPFAEMLHPLRVRLTELPAEVTRTRIPFVLVLNSGLVPAEKSMPLVEQDGAQGVVDMNPTQPSAFSPIDEVALPRGDAYLAVDIDTGKETLGVRPDDALPLITAQGRSPLTIDEGIAVLTHHPGLFRTTNAFSLLGSRRGDRRVPALWMSKGRPRLGWCWAGNPHTWLGTASCATRLG